MMAGAFEDYTIGWGGRDYVIPARRVLEVIGSVESVVTYGELLDFGRRGTAPFGRLSQAYGIILRAAGAQGADGRPISDYEVYSGIGEGLSDGELITLVNGLFALMTPPGAGKTQDEGGEPAPGNSPRAAAKASSKPSTKRSSVRAG